jgi:hypothetical protein
MDIKKTLLLGALTLSVSGFTGCASWGGGSTDDGRTTGRAVDDRQITQKIQAELRNEPVYKMQGVEVKTFSGVVQLSGFVDTQAQKQRAEQIARSVPGAANVVNQITIKPEPAPAGRLDGQQTQPGTTRDVDVDVDVDTNQRRTTPSNTSTDNLNR